MGTQLPQWSAYAMSIVAKRSPISATAEHLCELATLLSCTELSLINVIN